jgi:hypothetical protein
VNEFRGRGEIKHVGRCSMKYVGRSRESKNPPQPLPGALGDLSSTTKIKYSIQYGMIRKCTKKVSTKQMVGENFYSPHSL